MLKWHNTIKVEIATFLKIRIGLTKQMISESYKVNEEIYVFIFKLATFGLSFHRIKKS